MADPASTSTGSDPVARARALQPLVREAADEAERERRLPARVAEAMAKQGLYRVSAPRDFQGAEADPATQIRTIEAIAEADSAAGWNLMIGIESFGLLALGFPAGAKLLADPLAIVCSSTAAVGSAEVCDGGFRISGDWQFVSGCHNSHFFAGLVAEPGGGALPRFAVVARDQMEILDTWHVAGLRGSGSHDVRVRDVFVPEQHTASFGALPEDLPATPFTRIPTGTRLAYNKVGVGFGIARAAIDHFVELATGKVPRFSTSRLAEQTQAQQAIARAEARLLSSRAFVLAEVERLWDTVTAGDRPSDRDRALIQLACSDAALACAEAVEGLVIAAGTSANRLDSPLEKHARDVRVIRQHVTVAPKHIDDAGRVLLGLPPEELMLKLGG